MTFVIWIAVGGLVGWCASAIMGGHHYRGVARNIGVGVAGALLGDAVLGPLFGTGSLNEASYSLVGLGVSLMGALVLIAAVGLVRPPRRLK